MRTPAPLLLSALLIGIAPVDALLERRSAEAAAADQGEITIKAMDYAFELPATVRPGHRTIRLVGAGREAHHVWIVRIEEGKSINDFLAALRPGASLPSWAKSIGGPNAPSPGKESVAVVDLTPGHYWVICLIPSPDGKPHIMKGMMKPFEVTGAPVPYVAQKPTVSVTLSDYAFAESKPITAGHHVIELTNRSSQIHEAFLGKLAPGKTAADLMQWLAKMDGPPPGEAVGGLTGIEPGASASIVVDLEPGIYAWLCFVPDAHDGKEHVAHGMVKQFEVGPKRGHGAVTASGNR
jgi:uncharacterized cupredoxin-like copper-binding protein